MSNETIIERVKEVLGPVGEKSSNLFQGIVRWVAERGLNLSSIQTKIVALIILGGLLFLVLKFVSGTKRLIKWGISGLILVLIISIILSL